MLYGSRKYVAGFAGLLGNGGNIVTASGDGPMAMGCTDCCLGLTVVVGHVDPQVPSERHRGPEPWVWFFGDSSEDEVRHVGDAAA